MHARALVLALGLALGSVGCVAVGTRPDGDKVLKPQTYVDYGKMMSEATATKEYSEEQRREHRNKARLSFQKALEADPKCAEAHVGLGRLEAQVGNFAAAEEAFKKALVHAGRDAQLWAEVGQAQLKQKLWAAAAGSYQKAAEFDGGSRHVLSSLAACLIMSKQYPEAYAALVKLHGEAKACVEMARALAKMNEGREAAMLLVRAEQLAPGSPEVLRLRAELSGPRDAGTVQADYRVPATAPEVLSKPQEELRMPPRPVLSIRAGQ
ncbi:MAG: tetratricopeptide repeat protein [Gemmataceae bacterium]|nr:tetratricopeptide repeat protein [Gemmataceae bacterium]